jgi:hypothetical protein
MPATALGWTQIGQIPAEEIGASASGDNIAWAGTDGRIHIRDMATGRRRMLQQVKGCDFYGLKQAGLAYLCDRTRVVIERLDGRSARSVAVPLIGSPMYRDIDRVGRYWIQVTDSGYHWARTYFVERASGRRVDETDPSIDRAAVVPDVNRKRLARSICRPLRRSRYRDSPGFDDHRPFLRFGYEPPFALVRRYVGSGSRLAVERCGTRRHLRLPGPALDTRFSDGLVTWMDRKAAHALRVRTGTRVSVPWWRRGLDPRLGLELAHTPHALIATLNRGERGPQHVFATSLR